MRMSLQGNLNQVYPSDPSCCPLWPFIIIIINQGKKKQEKLGRLLLCCIFNIN